MFLLEDRILARSLDESLCCCGAAQRWIAGHIATQHWGASRKLGPAEHVKFCLCARAARDIWNATALRQHNSLRRCTDAAHDCCHVAMRRLQVAMIFLVGKLATLDFQAFVRILMAFVFLDLAHLDAVCPKPGFHNRFYCFARQWEDHRKSQQVRVSVAWAWVRRYQHVSIMMMPTFKHISTK